MNYSDVVSDSRLVTPGALFVAIPGVHTDGAQFIRQLTGKLVIRYITAK